MKSAVAAILTLFLAAGLAMAQASSPVTSAPSSNNQQELRSLLSQFMAGASNDDIMMFQRFFADDVIYTRNSGQTTTKAAILKSLSQPRKPGDAPPTKSTYSAEEVVVHDYGTTAVVNFVLVAKDGEGKITNYRDTGTFLKRNGRWQAVAWQATKISGGEK
jgi:hypothetical protein